jgi:hypothetical protein
MRTAAVLSSEPRAKAPWGSSPPPWRGFLHQVEDAPRVAEEIPPGRRQAQAAFLADEQLHTQVLLQLLDARGQVRRHAMNQLRGGADAALLGNGLEDFQLHQIHIILQS